MLISLLIPHWMMVVKIPSPYDIFLTSLRTYLLMHPDARPQLIDCFRIVTVVENVIYPNLPMNCTMMRSHELGMFICNHWLVSISVLTIITHILQSGYS